MPSRVTCPSCGTSLTVSDSAPRTLTCPRCLGKIDNPAAGSAASVGPMRVIPLEEDVRRDAKLSGGVIVLIVLAVLGGVPFMVGALNLAGSGIVVMVLLMFAAGAAVYLIGVRGGPAAVTHDAGAIPPDLPERGRTSGKVLDYSSIYARRAPMRVGAFILGFFGALGVCVACMILLGVTYVLKPPVLHLLFLGVVVAAVVGAVMLSRTLNTRSAWHGIGPGVMTGLMLGLLALGPCAFCYLFTI